MDAKVVKKLKLKRGTWLMEQSWFLYFSVYTKNPYYILCLWNIFENSFRKTLMICIYYFYIWIFIVSELHL